MPAGYLALAAQHPSSIVPAVLIVVAALVARGWYYAEKIPSVRTDIPLIGNILKYTQDPRGFVRNAGKYYGEVFKVNLLLDSTVWLMSPALNREYLITREDVWSFGDGMGMFLRKVVAPGYFDQLRTFVASLSRGITRNVALEHFNGLAFRETEKAIDDWSGKEGSMELFEETSYLVHKIIVQCLMGPDFYSKHVDELYEILHEMESNLGSILHIILPDWVPHPAARRLWNARDRTRKIFLQVLAEREKEPEKWEGALDYISYTLRDPVTAHLKHLYSAHHTLLMFAAHTSTVANVSWLLLELLKSPERLARLREELTANPDPEQSEFLGALVKETGRHYSGLNDLRLARKPKTLSSTTGSNEAPVTIPVGSVVSISPYLTHHDPQIWDKPLEYFPERWMEDPTLAKTLNDNSSVRYMPFGAGTHRCPGEKMAVMIIKTVVAKICMTCTLDWPEGDDGTHQDTNNLDFSKIGSPWLKGDVRVRIQKSA